MLQRRFAWIALIEVHGSTQAENTIRAELALDNECDRSCFHFGDQIVIRAIEL